MEITAGASLVYACRVQKVRQFQLAPRPPSFSSYTAIRNSPVAAVWRVCFTPAHAPARSRQPTLSTTTPIPARRLMRALSTPPTTRPVNHRFQPPTHPRVNKEASRRRRDAMSCTQLCRLVRTWPPTAAPATLPDASSGRALLTTTGAPGAAANVDAQRAAIDLEAIKVVHRRVGVVGVGEGHEAEATLPRRILALGELRAALDLSVLGEDLVEGGVVRAVVEVPDVHAAAVLILATAEVSARLLLAALRPRLRSEELHPHCPPIHVVAVKRVHSGLRARLLLEHHETETALAHRVEAVRHMLGADDGAELAEDVGEVLVLRREVEVAHEELALLLRVQRPGRRREVVALRLGRAHEVVSDGLLRHRDADHGARSAAGGDRRRRHEGERRGIGGA
eukprot:CAMPEP_0119474626 /NCGR_PEP_ID=MMETSP1344-20130328/5806_1 /TAXON_ID=236787 /ORGANISM="Florenciella parvula, Strain CCMP2471" /LENGTH=394 /DNA_ID=CAMNT_0007507953 /DNA_START=325 /DNA_END=1507 /DNA_ORIENTATION=-